MDLMKKDPLLCAAGLEGGLGFELDNLATFLAGSMKDKAVGQYYMNAGSLEGDQFKGFDNIYGPDLLNILSTIYEEQTIADFGAIDDKEFTEQEGQTPKIKQEHYSPEGADFKRITMEKLNVPKNEEVSKWSKAFEDSNLAIAATMPERFSDLVKGAQNAKAQLNAAAEMFQEIRQAITDTQRNRVILQEELRARMQSEAEVKAESQEIVRDQAQAKAKSTKKAPANRAKAPRKAREVIAENKQEEVAKKRARRSSGKKVLTLDTINSAKQAKKARSIG